MLAAKTDKKKNLIQTTVLIAVLATTGFVIYKNFFSQPTIDPTVTGVVTTDGLVNEDNIKTGSEGSLPEFSTSELDFIQIGVFRRLRDFTKPIIIKEERSNNPFSADSTNN